MTRQEERILRSALIFTISEPRFIRTPENAKAIAQYFDQQGLAGDSVADFNRAFAALNGQRLLLIPYPKATARELEKLSTTELESIAEHELTSRTRSYQRFRAAQKEKIK